MVLVSESIMWGYAAVPLPLLCMIYVSRLLCPPWSLMVPLLSQCVPPLPLVVSLSTLKGGDTSVFSKK